MTDPNQPPAEGGDPFAPPPSGETSQPYGSTPPPSTTPSAPPPSTTPAPPSYQAPPPSYGAPTAPPASYGGYAAPQNTPGTVALVCGIVGIFFCGVVLGIVAIIQGRKGKQLAAQGLATNGGAAQAGYILGIIDIALFVIGIIFYAVVLSSGNK